MEKKGSLSVSGNKTLKTEDEVETIQTKSHRELWEDIVKETDEIRKCVEKHKLLKNPVLLPPPHPVIEYLDKNVFPLINAALTAMLNKVKAQENEIFTEGDTYLNSLNFIAEYMWNMNSNHPERKENWTDIHNIIW